MTNRRPVLIIILFIAYAAAFCFGQDKNDYLILSSPLDYTIFNEYEEPLSPAEKGAFLPFSPLLVTDPNVTLGDQITKALKFEFQRRSFFLLKDEKGIFVGEKAKTVRHLYKTCTQIEDTIDILRRGITVGGLSGGTNSIPKGARLNRIFKSGSRFYVLTLGDRPVYGWCSLEQNGAWRKVAAALRVEKDVADTALPPNLVSRIQEKMSGANDAYKALFAHFNMLTKDEKTAPFWRCEQSGARIRYELSGAVTSGDQLAESTQSLAQELENVILGTPFMVRHANREIVIERRAESH